MNDFTKLRELAETIVNGEHLIKSGMCSGLDLVDARFEFLEMASTQVPALITALDEARAEAARLREALSALTNKLEAVHADSRYETVWRIAHLHIGPYEGPQYDKELLAARQALEVKP